MEMWFEWLAGWLADCLSGLGDRLWLKISSFDKSCQSWMNEALIIETEVKVEDHLVANFWLNTLEWCVWHNLNQSKYLNTQIKCSTTTTTTSEKLQRKKISTTKTKDYVWNTKATAKLTNIYWLVCILQSSKIGWFTCDTLVAIGLEVVGNEYSNGFVMAITELRISGVSGVLVAVPTVKFVVLVTDGWFECTADDDAVVTISTFSIGTPFILSLKL